MNRYILTILSLILFVFGLFVILKSSTWGSEAANAYLSSQGGGMDTAQFVIFLQEYIHTYQWIGSILSVSGGLGLVKAIESR